MGGNCRGVRGGGSYPEGELVRGNCPGGKSPEDYYPGGNFVGTIVLGAVVQGEMSGYPEK